MTRDTGSYNMHRGVWSRVVVTVALMLLLVGGLSVALYNNLTHNFPGANDFYIPWRATQALFLEGRNPYSADVTRDIQIVLFGAPRRPDEHQYAFAYPLPVSLLIAPLVRLPYDAAEAIWLSLCLTLLMLSLAGLTLPASPRGLLLFLAFGVLFYPAARSLILGQFAIVAWTAFTAGLLALRAGGRDAFSLGEVGQGHSVPHRGARVWRTRAGRRWDWLAGAAFAVSALKPQMVFLALPVVVLWAIQQRRFALLASGLIVLGVLSGIALIALPSWPADFLESLRAYNAYVELNSPTGILLGDNALHNAVDLLLVAALGIYLWREWAGGWAHLEAVVFFGLIVSQLIAPRTSTTNQIILLIPLVLWLKRLDAGRRLAIMLVLVIAPWAVFLATIRGNEEQPPAFLFVPFFCLAWALLEWFRNGRLAPARERVSGQTVNG
jgi:hypothetical protein